MKTVLVVLALVVSSPAAHAACYMIYTPANELVWRAPTPPVPMDTLALDAAVHRIVPLGHLIISNHDGAPCRVLDLTAGRKTLREQLAQEKNG
jgi:hypothetical protein